MEALQSPLALIFLYLVVWALVYAVFRWLWRRTKAGREWREYALRLDIRVKRFAASIWWLALVLLAIMAMSAALHFRRVLHPGESLSDASPLAVALIAVSSYMISLYPASVLMNLACALKPSMRSAMRAAGADLPAVTTRNGHLLLMTQGAILIPISVVQLYFGVVIR